MRGWLLALLIAWSLPGLAALDEAERERWRDAVEHNRVAVIGELLARVENVDLPARRDKTALMAAAAGGAPHLARALIDRGADPHALNTMGSSALIYAAWSGDVAVIRLLLEHEVDLDQQASNGWGAVMMAAAKRRVAALHLLCEAGADPNRADVYFWTPLMRAAYEGHSEVVTALLNCPEVDLAALNDRGQTVLHLAAIQGDVGIFQALLVHGTEPGVADYDGNTPRSIAAELGHREILALLEAAAVSRSPSAGG